MVWFYGVSRETLRNWTNKGMPRGGPNRYPHKKCHEWIQQNIFALDESTNNDINQEKLLRERAKRIQDEIKAKTMLGQVVPRDQAIYWVSVLVSETKQALIGLPRRLAASLATKTDERDVESELRAELTGILRDLSRPLEREKRKKKGRIRKKHTH